MHGKSYQENKHTELASLADAVMAYAEERVRISPPLDQPMSQGDLDRLVGQTITAEGFGGVATMRMFAEDLAPTCLSTDHPRYLSFIPCAPSDAAVMFDLVVGASSIYAGSWLEGSGAVYAENQALRWIADLVGMPAGAGGVFTPGGTIGNLSALVAARHTARRTAAAGVRPNRVAATAGAHSSISSACDVMDAELVGVPVDDRWRLTGPSLRAVLEENGPETFFAVVATCGTTNFGIIDDLASVAEVCREFGIWFHVDGAYGGAGLAAPSVRDLYAGIEHCDSFIVDPHKWLFAPFDCCALLYREPAEARAAHTQRAGYLDVLTEADEWNPTDYSVGLTRRARGLPFWFSLAVNGTDSYDRRDRAHPRRRPVRRGRGAPAPGPRARARARPVGRGLPTARLGTGRLPGLVGPDAGRGVRVRRPDDPRRRDAGPLRDRQPGDQRGRHHGDPRHHGLSPPVGIVGLL